jgi:hypothetical protein
MVEKATFTALLLTPGVDFLLLSEKRATEVALERRQNDARMNVMTRLRRPRPAPSTPNWVATR